ncbi:DUF3147 family protein [Alicyclobacillus mali]|uniref:DUF3147 family protein n=1 Tax=Alicyclobacillus mali (ex Roth et al. 2021) TaxID=1123961 RepID=A0ABS0F5C0_9BACL|nr:DUF3147 family protein [Alicyclobacillus mali (ex Roth et al. 2021)]MBF8378472.1 DUF3147 family protein [Alicyclobacillus mali (ex Roth et al. 2021)]
MLMTFMKATVSAAIVTAVTVLAKKYPGLGGWIAALPIVSLLSATWLVVEKVSGHEVARFLAGVLSGLLPTAILLAVTIALLYRGWPFSRAVVLAVAAWLFSSILLSRMTGL